MTPLISSNVCCAIVRRQQLPSHALTTYLKGVLTAPARRSIRVCGDAGLGLILYCGGRDGHVIVFEYALRVLGAVFDALGAWGTVEGSWVAGGAAALACDYDYDCVSMLRSNELVSGRD